MLRLTNSRLSLLIIVIALAALAAPRGVSAGWHVVQPDETLAVIAETYGVSIADIAEANGIINPDLIVVGDELWVPDPVGGGTGGGSITYIVQPDDTIASIAAAFGVDSFGLALINEIEDPWLIYPGQELIIPVAGGVPAPAPPASPYIDYDVPYYDEATVRWIVVQLSQAYGWDAYMILSLAWRESNWEQRAVSSAGAVGVLQLMPDTAAWAGPALVGREVDYVYDAWDNIETGIAYLSHLRTLTGSDYLALAAYFQGLGSVERDGIFVSTRDYALGIIEMRDLFANGALP